MVETLFSWIDFLFSFKGRIGRLAFWGYNIGLIAVVVFVLYIPEMIGLEPPAAELEPPDNVDAILIVTLVMPIYGGYMWSGFAVTAKRFHDRNKSGFWTLIGFVPFGSFWILIECGFLRGTDGPNRFGEDPRSPEGNLVEVFE